jgi:hypothetical protein
MTGRRLVSIVLLAATARLASGAGVTGHVFRDSNGNGRLDKGESGLAGVLVSAWDRTASTSPSGAYRLELPAGAHVIHASWPDGVWPATDRFWQQVSLGAADERTVDFPMRPRTVAPPFHVVQLTDTHATREQLDRMTRLCEGVNALRQKPAFVVNTGDLGAAGSARSDAEADASWAKGYLPCVEPLDAPLFHTCGSGDYGGARVGGWTGERKLVGRGGFRRYCGPLNYAFSAGGWHFVFIETVTPREDGRGVERRIPPQTLRWLKAYLASVSRWEPKALFCHARPDQAEEGARELADLLKGRDFRAIFAGHDHAVGRFEFAYIPGFVTAAASGFKWSAHNLSGDAQGYRVIEFERNRAFASAYVCPWREHHVQLVTPDVSRSLHGKVDVFATVFDPADTVHSVRIGVGTAVKAAALTRHGPFKDAQTTLWTDRLAEGGHDLWLVVQRLDKVDTARTVPIHVTPGAPKPFQPVDAGRLYVRARNVDADASVLVNGQQVGTIPSGTEPDSVLTFAVPMEALARSEQARGPVAAVTFEPGRNAAGQPVPFDVSDIIIRYDGHRRYDPWTTGRQFARIEPAAHLRPPTFEARILLTGQERYRAQREPGKEFVGGFYVRAALDTGLGAMARLRVRYACTSREPRSMSVLLKEGEKTLLDVQVEDSFAAFTHTFLYTPRGLLPTPLRAELIMLDGGRTTSKPARPPIR